MPSLNTFTSTGNGEAPVWSVTSVEAPPITFHEAISEVPKGPQVVTHPVEVQLTRRSTRIRIKRNTTLAAHWINVPLVDGLMTVSRLFLKLKSMAFNYQREHIDAFFDQYPNAVILRAEERDDPDYRVNTTNWLRANYEKLCMRLAHYFYHYMEGKKFQTAALAELNLLTRLNGNEWTKSIASQVRWTRINASCNMYERFPFLDDSENGILQYAKYATGKTTYGSDIVSVPLYVIDCYGNRGRNMMDPYAMMEMARDQSGLVAPIATFGSGDQDGNVLFPTDKSFPHPGSYDGPSGTVNPNELLRNMRDTVEWMQSNSLVSPFVDNGAMIHTVNDDNTAGASRKLMCDQDRQLKFDALNWGKEENNFTARYWNGYYVWTKYLITNFSEMMDPNHDIYLLAGELIGVKPASKLEDFNNAVRAMPNVSIVDLANRMVYSGSKSGSPNTATLITYKPVMSGWRTERQAFIDNWERFPVVVSDPAYSIAVADYYPRFTPTVFPMRGHFPLVLNALPSVSEESTELNPDTQTKRSSWITPTGRYATILDLACNAQANLEENQINLVGVSEDVGRAVIEGRKAFVYEEDPSNIHVMANPTICTHDPLQCGFMILLCWDDPNPNEWTLYLTRPEDRGVSPNFVGTAGEGDSEHVVGPCFTSVEEEVTHTTNHLRLATFNLEWRSRMKYNFVFVGGALFNHPVLALSDKSAGWFRSRYIKQLNPAYAADGMFKHIFAKDLKSEATQEGVLQRLYIDDVSWDPRSAALRAGRFRDLIEDWGFGYYHVSPEYGPFGPITEVTPSGPFDGYLLPIYRSQELSDPYKPSIKAFTPEYPVGELSRGGSFSVNTDAESLRPKPRFDPFYTPAEQIAWFIESVSLQPSTVREGFPQLADYGVINLEFHGISNWAFRMAAVTQIQYAGYGEFKPFWKASDDMRPDPVSLSSTSEFPENNVLALPRVPRGKASFTQSRPAGGKADLQSSYQAADRAIGGNPKRSRPSKGGHRKGGHTGPLSKAPSYEADKEPTNRMKDPDPSILISGDGLGSAKLPKPAEGNAFDNTSESTDVKLDRAKKRTSPADNKTQM